MLTYTNFLSLPVKIRCLFIKKLLNQLNYKLSETYKEDKDYKTALKHFQFTNKFATNCVISENVFYTLIKQVEQANQIWKEIKMR